MGNDKKPMNIKKYRRFFFYITCLFFIFFSNIGNTQTNGPRQVYQLISGNNYVQSKNYYLLTLMQELPDVRKLVNTDTVLMHLAKVKTDSLDYALKNCGRDGFCYISKLQFSEAEINIIGRRLAILYQPENALGRMMKYHLIPSGCYVLFNDLPPAQMLVKAWMQDAAGINYCIGVYGQGKKPHYPLIDSISFNTKNPHDSNMYLYNYVSLLYNTTSVISSESKDNTCFFYPSLTAALEFLEMNEREQAGDYEPMVSGENKAAVTKIKNIDWKKYTYSVILVPGAGPEDAKVALSAEGMLRCRLAAIQYRKGMAPFIIVSGGKVHPYKTKFCEATEMKKYLIEKLHIPPSAVIIEPHARHTTTNMRNTVRLMYRYGIPFKMPGLTCTTRGQSKMIGVTLTDRCLKELNEVPYKTAERLSETILAFYPLIEALHINPTEPLDP